MSWSFKLITIRGIPIRVHLSFLLILVWAAYIGLTGSSEWLRGATFMVIFTLLLFLCVVLHELSHSLVAQLFGVKVYDITLWPIGGVARFAKLPERPYQEFLITAAGPAVNILLTIGFAALALVWIGPSALGRLITSPRALEDLAGSMNGQALVLLLAVNNALLALFNLLPAFPMDGGRLLRALLAAVFPFGKATRIASIGGQIVATGMGAAALLTGNLMLGLVAAFVFVAAWQERQGTATAEGLRDLRVRQAMQPLGLRLHPLQTVSEVLNQMISTPQSAYPVVDGGRLVAVITRGELLAGARKASADARLNATMPQGYVILPPDILLTEAQERLQARQAAAVVENGQAIGLLSAADLTHAAEVMEVYGRCLSRKNRGL